MADMNRRQFLRTGAEAELAWANYLPEEGESSADPIDKVDIYFRHLQWFRSPDEVAEAAKQMGCNGAVCSGGAGNPMPAERKKSVRIDVREPLNKSPPIPQGLKPHCNGGTYGATEVAPFQNGALFRDALEARQELRGSVYKRGNVAMRMMFRSGLALTAVSLLTAAAWAPPAVLPDGPGKAAVQASCLNCHAADVIAKKHATKDNWGAIINDMQGRGAEVADPDFDTISTYLAAHFGVAVNVNKASADDFINWFSMTKAEADAMVAYRKSHGDFKTVDDLLKVPDVDAAKIQSQAAHIAFQDATPPDAH